jgi:hypothetical protein
VNWLQMRHTFWGMGQEEVQASMGPILGALGLKLAVLSDDEALARIRYRLPLRGTSCGAGRGLDWRMTWRAARELAAALMRLQKGR